MDFSDPHQRAVFFDVHDGLARQGPGNRASGERALAIARPFPPRPASALRVIDIACGPGLQTVELAEMLPDATILATDMHGPFLDQLRALAIERGVSDRIETCRCDMAALDVGDEEVDLIWCEGAAYIMGFGNALADWKRLLAPGGRLALTEPVWLAAQPPPRVTQCWAEYPDLADLETRLGECEAAGYEVLGHFVLPDDAWWDHYYGPMDERLAILRSTNVGDAVAQSVLDETELEIECHRDLSTYYGYAFFVLTPKEE